MDHDVAAGGKMPGGGVRLVCWIGVGDMQGEMEAALQVLGVDGVEAFRGLMIALMFFWARASGAERDLVDLDGFAWANKVRVCSDFTTTMPSACSSGGVSGALIAINGSTVESR
jgi:hypothetical protein